MNRLDPAGPWLPAVIEPVVKPQAPISKAASRLNGKLKPGRRPSGAMSKRAEFLARLEAIADGQPRAIVHEEKGGHARLRELPTHLTALDAVEWLSPFFTVTRTKETYTVSPVPDLRAVFDDYRAGKNLPEVTGVGAFARQMRDEIRKREEEMIETRRAAGWSTNKQMTVILERLINWVKAELDRVLGEQP